jgi:tetratricopeptide (TPR) repeat protein
MKRVGLILSSVILGSSLFVSVEAQTLNEQYSQALVYYKNKKFKESYTLFSKLYMSKLSDAKLNFYLGRSAFETGHYEAALAAFERVEMLDPGNLRNKLEMARTYFMLGMHEKAQAAFEEVLQNENIPQNVRTNIELYLAKVKGAQKRSFTYATVDVDVLYDSNVNYGSLDSQYNINTGTLPATPEKSDMALQVYGDVVNVYDIGEKNGFALKNRLSALWKKYQDENDYDVKYIGYIPSLLYTQTKSLMELALGIDSLTLASDEYLRTFSLSPRYEYKHTNTLRSIAYFKYQKKDFQRVSEKELDANHYELAYGLQNILSPRSYVQGNLIAINEKKTGGTRIDVDYSEYRAILQYAQMFTPQVGGEFFAQYRRRAYDDFSTLFGSTRLDNGGTVAATVNYKVIHTLNLHLKGMYNRVHSNQNRFSYQKYTLAFGISKTF